MLRPIWDAFSSKKYAEKAFYERKSPNQGTKMGSEIAPRPGQCGTNAKTSERQQAGYKTRGPGACPWCSFLRLSSKKAGLPRRSRRGPRGAAPQGGFGATYPKGTYPPFPGEEPLISPGAAAGYPPPKTPGRGTPPGAGRPPGPSTAGGCPRDLSWRRSPCASRR